MNRKRIFVISLIPTIGILSIIFSYWYTHTYLSPDAILLRSLSHIQRIGSLTYTGSLHLSYDMPDSEKTIVKEPLSFSSGFVGSYEKKKDEDTPRVSFSGTVNAGNKTISEFESSLINRNLYVLIKTLADIGFVDNQKILNKWIFIDLSKVPQNISSLFVIPFWQVNEGVFFQEVTKKSPITIEDVMDTEVIEGLPTYHYRYHIDNETMRSLLSLSNIDISHIHFQDGEVWIDPKKEEIVEMTFYLKHEQSERGTPEIAIQGHIGFDQINKPVVIDTPSSTIPFEDLLRQVVKER